MWIVASGHLHAVVLRDLLYLGGISGVDQKSLHLLLAAHDDFVGIRGELLARRGMRDATQSVAALAIVVGKDQPRQRQVVGGAQYFLRPGVVHRFTIDEGNAEPRGIAPEMAV